VTRVRSAQVDQHGAASGITGILNGKGPAIRCANGPLHACSQDVSGDSRAPSELFVPETAGCHSWPSPRQAPNPRPAVNDCQLVSMASLMIGPGSFSQVELGGLNPRPPACKGGGRARRTCGCTGQEHCRLLRVRP
jgi:hypothetical protein